MGWWTWRVHGELLNWVNMRPLPGDRGVDRTYKRNLTVLDEFFAGMRFDQMDTNVFRAFRKKRRHEDIDDSTINRNLSLLRRMKLAGGHVCTNVHTLSL